MTPTTQPLTGQLLTREPVLVEEVAGILSEHAGLHLDQGNTLHGQGVPDGLRVQLETGLEPLGDESLPVLAQLNGVQDLLGDALQSHRGFVRVLVEGADDPRPAISLLCRVMATLSRVDRVVACHLASQQLLTTPELFRATAEGPVEGTWVSAHALWMEPEVSSLGVTRGLTAFGLPELQMAGVPWQPVQTRAVLHGLAADMLRQGMPVRDGLQFHLGELSMTLATDLDRIGGNACLSIVPTELLAEMRAQQSQAAQPEPRTAARPGPRTQEQPRSFQHVAMSPKDPPPQPTDWAAIRERVVAYLQGGHVIAAARGLMVDVLDSTRGEVVPMNYRTDGVFTWPGGAGYYCAEHDVVPHPALLEHMRRNAFVLPEVDDQTAEAALRSRQENDALRTAQRRGAAQGRGNA